MKKIAIVTSTRAEYGLLKPVVRELRKYESALFKTELIVTGTHLSECYGDTIREIKDENIRIDHIIPVSVKSDSELDISENQAEYLISFTKLFIDECYSAVILLGDRYETLAVAIAAGNTRIPIFHLCGGDTTEGAIDEWIRHSISKISYLHFVTNMSSRKRVIQLGEDPERVFLFGSTSIDNILSESSMTKAEALDSIGMKDCRYALCTYHPVTMEKGGSERMVNDFLEAVKAFPDLEFLVTKANADQGGAKINEILETESKRISNLHVYSSLGIKRYLSLMRHAEFVLGNSSSGIIEAPAFHIPTVNIGDRQRGRLQSESVINCMPDRDHIVEAIRKASDEHFRDFCLNVNSCYGDGCAAKKIAEKCYETIMNDQIDLKKRFYDLEFKEQELL